MRGFTDAVIIKLPNPGDEIDGTKSVDVSGFIGWMDPDDDSHLPPKCEIHASLIYADGSVDKGHAPVDFKKEWKVTIHTKNFKTPGPATLKVWLGHALSGLVTESIKVLKGAGAGGTIILSSPFAGSTVTSPFASTGTIPNGPTNNVTGTLTGGDGTSYTASLANPGPNWQLNFPGVSTTLYNAMLKVWCVDDPFNTWTQETLAAVYPPPPPRKFYEAPTPGPG
jgi:hypothetical protein